MSGEIGKMKNMLKSSDAELITLAVKIISGVGGKASLVTLECIKNNRKFSYISKNEKLKDSIELQLSSSIGDASIKRRKHGNRTNDKTTN